MGQPTDSTETGEYAIPREPEATIASAQPKFKLDFAAVSDAGKVRSNNEDHFLITRMGRTFNVVSTNMPAGSLPDNVDEEAYGMVVADGMGGMAAGEKASLLAIQTGVNLVLNSPMWATRIDEAAAHQLITRMRDYFRKVDSVVFGEARSDRHLSGMGTTLTLAYIVKTDAFVVHVGDSRAYLHRKGKLEQLTRDHTMAQGLADAGSIRPEEVPRHAKRHVLTNFVGGPSSGVEPEVSTLELRQDDFLLLCSDGLTEMVRDAEIASILDRSPTADAASKTLLGLALDRGGRDNVTILLARVEVG
jgi:serine/threonine protein phosphatase PrpC